MTGSYQDLVLMVSMVNTFGVDVEGATFLNPAYDFAKMMLESMSSDTRAAYEKPIAHTFDTFDDMLYYCGLELLGLAYLIDGNDHGVPPNAPKLLSMIGKHSTGAMPVVAMLAYAADGKTDADAIALRKEKVKENPGADKLAKFLKEKEEEYGTTVYMITNSPPPMALVFADKYGIPLSRVYCAGFQLSQRQREEELPLEKEIARRSPLSVLSGHKDELREFLDEYLNICGKILPFAEQYDIESVVRLMPSYKGTFEHINDEELRNTIRYLLLEEMGVMGGHNKMEVLQTKAKTQKCFAIGDGIVDALMVNYADAGTSINTTNEHLLRSSTFNICTADMGHSNYLDFLDRIINGKITHKNRDEVAKELSTDDFKIYTANQISSDLEIVKAENSKFKKELKAKV